VSGSQHSHTGSHQDTSLQTNCNSHYVLCGKVPVVTSQETESRLSGMAESSASNGASWAHRPTWNLQTINSWCPWTALSVMSLWLMSDKTSVGLECFHVAQYFPLVFSCWGSELWSVVDLYHTLQWLDARNSVWIVAAD